MSGANNNVPQVPTFTSSAPSVDDLNNLSYAVQFLVQQDVRPTWNFYNTATQSLTSSAYNILAANKVAFDCDGVYDSVAAALIVTQGQYALEACISFEITSAKNEIIALFVFQAGANNPNFAPNAVVRFGWRGTSTSTTGSAAADNTICLSDITPMVLYPGDVITLQAFPSYAATLDFNQNTSYIQGRFVSKFTGYLIATQPPQSFMLDEAGNFITDEPGGDLW